MNNTIESIIVDYEGYKTLKWAKECINEAFKKFIITKKRSFTVSAAPNSGKTRMAGTFAKIGIDKYFFDRNCMHLQNRSGHNGLKML